MWVPCPWTAGGEGYADACKPQRCGIKESLPRNWKDFKTVWCCKVRSKIQRMAFVSSLAVFKRTSCRRTADINLAHAEHVSLSDVGSKIFLISVPLQDQRVTENRDGRELK